MTPGDPSDLNQHLVDELLAVSTMPWTDVTVVASTGSTNADLMARVAAGEAVEGAVLAAGEQVAGRGRLDRDWASPAGSTLSFSVVLSPPVERSGFVPALTALAVARAIRGLSDVPVTLKWPNDVMAEHGKVAGILAEGSRGHVVVGCGINVSVPQADLPVPTASSLSLEGASLDRARLLVTALEQIHAANDLWREAAYSATGSGLLDVYRELCGTIGVAVEVTLPDGSSVQGTAQAVDDEGRLQLTGPGGSRTLTAGDVVHLRPA